MPQKIKLGCDIPQPIIHIHKVTNLVSYTGRTSRFYKVVMLMHPTFAHGIIVSSSSIMHSHHGSTQSESQQCEHWCSMSHNGQDACYGKNTFMHSDFMNINSLSSIFLT